MRDFVINTQQYIPHRCTKTLYSSLETQHLALKAQTDHPTGSAISFVDQLNMHYYFTFHWRGQRIYTVDQNAIPVYMLFLVIRIKSHGSIYPLKSFFFFCWKC